MSARTVAAIEIWRARTPRTGGDRAYLVYAILLGLGVVIAPVARAVWLSAVSPEGIAALASPAAPAVTAVVVAALWAAALALGRERGPALMAPFLTHALASSDLRRSATFRAPVLRSGMLVVAATTAAAGVAGGALLQRGLTDPLGVVSFAVAGALAGAIATIAWLAGQAFPRIASPLALGLLALGVCTALVPVLRPFTPWGWVGLAYPTGGSMAAVGALIGVGALIALTVALAVVVPAMLGRLTVTELMAQAVRWESATGHAMTMDLSLASGVYRGRPYFGRGIRAVRPVRPARPAHQIRPARQIRPTRPAQASRQRRRAKGLPMLFLIRDAVGAIRTPGRFVVGVLALVTAGVLLVVACAPATPGWLLGVAAGLVASAGLGAFTDGIRHAANVAGDFPLYGISDERVLANHATFPLVVVIVVLLVAVSVCSLAFGLPAAAPSVSALALGALTLLARIASALKGPMPPVLLTPIPTPMGDMGAAMRLIWAVDGVLIAGLVGASAALAADLPVMLAIVTIALVGVGVSRWRHRG